MRPGDDIDLTLVSAASSSVYAGYSAASRFVDVDGVNNPRISVTKGDTLRFLTHSPTLTDTKIEFFLDPKLKISKIASVLITINKLAFVNEISKAPIFTSGPIL